MRKALGKGLSQLLGDQLEAQVMEAPIDSITPNSRQPRRHFDEESLEELADSIRVHGILSPIIVRPVSDGKYEIIAGERRWRASKLAGLKNVPISVRSAAGQESLEIAIIENVQRADISAYESALAYQALIDEFGLTQEEVALRVGKTRTAISNLLRLLRLPYEVLQELQVGKITEGHARALLAFGSEVRQLEVLHQIKEEGLSVRDVEWLSGPVDPKPGKKKKPAVPTRDSKDLHTKQLESAISEKLGTAARIERTGERGNIVLPFFDDEDLQRILDSLGVEL